MFSGDVDPPRPRFAGRGARQAPVWPGEGAKATRTISVRPCATTAKYDVW